MEVYYYKIIPVSIRKSILQQLKLDPSNPSLSLLLQQDSHPSNRDQSLKILKLRYSSVAIKLIKQYKDQLRSPLKKKHNIPQETNQVQIAQDLKFPSRKQPQAAKLTGINFYTLCFRASKSKQIKLRIPNSYLFGVPKHPVIHLYTARNGYIKSQKLTWKSLKSQLKNQSFIKTSLPGYVMKSDIINDQSLIIDVYRFQEWKEMFQKAKQHSESGMCVIQNYIVTKTHLPAKVRVSFNTQIQKAVTVRLKERYKKTKASFKEFQVMNFFDNSANLSLHQKNLLFHTVFKIPKNLPITNNTLCYSSEQSRTELINNFIQISDFLQQLAGYLGPGAISYKEKLKLKQMRRYFLAKRDKYVQLLTSQQKFQNKREISQFSFTIDLSFPKHLQASNTTPLARKSGYSSLLLELKRLISLRIQPISLKVTQIVADFIQQSSGALFLISLDAFSFTEYTKMAIPKQTYLRHVSLLLATEASAVSRIKNTKVCCGDYCEILKLNDVQMKNRLEDLKNSHAQFSYILGQLLELQQKLNQNIVIEGIQYKILRRTVLNDRDCSFSLKNQVLSLPFNLREKIGFPFKEQAVISPFKISFQKEQERNNKRLEWEFDSVPVCCVCYQIYSDLQEENSKFKYMRKSNQQLSRAISLHEVGKRVRSSGQFSRMLSKIVSKEQLKSHKFIEKDANQTVSQFNGNNTFLEKW